MWTYRQSTGEMITYDGTTAGVGYSGAGEGKNKTTWEQVHDIGPIPRGKYTMEPPIDTKVHGPYVMWLVPDPANQMFGRGGFGIHGDSVVHPGMASEGCVILARSLRQQVWDSGDHILEVVT